MLIHFAPCLGFVSMVLDRLDDDAARLILRTKIVRPTINANRTCRSMNYTNNRYKLTFKRWLVDERAGQQSNPPFAYCETFVDLKNRIPMNAVPNLIGGRNRLLG